MHPCMHASAGTDPLFLSHPVAVELLSLRVQLKPGSASGQSKGTVAGKVCPEPENEEARCTAVVWLPKTDMFAVACASGSIYVYKKVRASPCRPHPPSLHPPTPRSPQNLPPPPLCLPLEFETQSSIVSESSSKFLSLGSSSNKNSGPVSIFAVGGGLIHDMAVSPDGSRLAVACKDGVLRILDLATGACLHGMHSFFGAFLCCSFSADGKFVAAGSEDDLVSVYSMAVRDGRGWGEGGEGLVRGRKGAGAREERG
jgi:WD40 repeat protein